MQAFFFPILFLAGIANAQDFERIAPKPVAPPGQIDEGGPRSVPSATAVRLKELQGIVFLTDPKAVAPTGAQGNPQGNSGLDTSRVPELQTDAFRTRMAKYLGRPVSAASLDALIRDVVAYYGEIDRPFVVVSSPEQDVTGGVLQLVVIEGRVGEVKVRDATVFSESIYRNAIGLKPGDRISKSQLDSNVDFLNRNPFREASVTFEPGKSTGTTDVTVRTRERAPFRLYAGYDDTGTEVTDTKRVSAGVNWGNVFGLDHQLNYQYSASPDFDTFRAHSATYIAPLPWRHLLTVFGGHADIKGRVPAPFAFDGRSTQIGLRYEVPLRKWGSYSHSVVGGLDYKKTNNNLEFGGVAVNPTSAEIFQGLLSYQGRATDAYGLTSFNATGFYSPGGVTGDNEDANFRGLRAFAEAQYGYVNLQAQRVTRLPLELSWHASAEIQFADGNLLGSEQIGAGGFSSVRGFDEREANGDEGFIVRNELRGPSWNLGAPFAGKQAQLQLLAFVDYGSVRNRRLLPGERSHIDLASAGLGTRFAVDQNVTVRLDYGWQLKDSGIVGTPRNGRAHFSLLVSY